MNKFLLAGVLAASTAASAQAGVLAVNETLSDPIYSSPNAPLEYLELFDSGELSGFSIPITGLTAELFIAVGWNLTDPLDLNLFAGAFAIDDLSTGSTVLDAGLATAISDDNNLLQFRFGTLGGTAAGDFANGAVLELDLGLDLPDGFDSLEDGTLYDGSATIYAVETAPAAIPLPAALPLFAFALGGLALLRRR